MRFFMQVHSYQKLKLIPRGRVLVVVRGRGNVLQGQSRHRPRKFASPAPSSRASSITHNWAQEVSGDMVNTWTKLTHDPVNLIRKLGPHASLFPNPNHRAAGKALTERITGHCYFQKE